MALSRLRHPVISRAPSLLKARLRSRSLSRLQQALGNADVAVQRFASTALLLEIKHDA